MGAYRKRIAIIGAIAVGVVGIAGTALGAEQDNVPAAGEELAHRFTAFLVVRDVPHVKDIGPGVGAGGA